MKRFARPLALILFGIAVGLLLGEGMARILYTRPWYEQLVIEQTGGEWAANVWRNRYGLRDRDYPSPKPDHTVRVLLLGDSFTYGSGLADNGATFAELVEARLDAEFAPHGKRVEVLNGGVPGSLTTDWVELLQKVRGEFQPDVIVVVFFLRDGTRVSAYDAFYAPIRDEIVARNRASVLYQYVYLYRWARDLEDRALISERFTRAIHEAYTGSPFQQEEWRTAQFNLKQIKAIGEETGTRTALVVFPILADLAARYPFAEVCDLLVRFGADNELPTLNLLPAFLGKNAPDLWVSAGNQHPNAKGHAIAADAMTPFIRQLVLETMR